MRRVLQQAGLSDAVVCDSAGTSGAHRGSLPDARIIDAGRRRGLPMTGSARQVTRADLDRFDLILAMDDDNYTGLRRLATPGNQYKIKRFCEYCVAHADSEVPDPYYGGADGFEYVLDLMEDGCTEILRQISSDRDA